MRITLCARRFMPPFVGGVDVYAERLGRALQRLGHEVTVLAVDSNKDRGNSEITVSQDEYHGTKISRLEFAFAERPKEAFDYLYDPEMGQVIREVLQDQKPDLFVILNFYMVTLAAVDAANSLGIPVIHVATDFLPICRRATLIRWDGRPCQVGESIKSCAECFVSHRFPGRLAASALKKLPEEMLLRMADNHQLAYRPPHPLWAFKPYWKQVTITERRLQTLKPVRTKIDLVLTPTQFTRKMFLENGFTPDQVYFLPFGVERDHPLANTSHIPAPHTRFLFIGRFQPYKGLHLLLEAFNNLSSPKGATLTIYGAADGYDAYYDQLQVMIINNERIRFGGTLASDALKSAFGEADYFVLPSTWHENSPLILLDALQSKTPVIASNIGGVTDIVKDGVNGILFPMGDIQALQQVLQRVIDQPTLVEQLRSGVNLPGMDDYAVTMLQLYEGRL